MTAREAPLRLADCNRKFTCVSPIGCSYSESAAKYRFLVEILATIAVTDAVCILRCELGIFMMTARRMAAQAGCDPAALPVTSFRGSENWDRLLSYRWFPKRALPLTCLWRTLAIRV